jgi:hypothetical protein
MGYPVVINVIQRFRGLPIAVLALALSAGLVLAAQPDAASFGLATAASHAGKTVPVQAGADESTQGNEDQGTEADASEAPESASDSANCSTDPTGLTDEQLAAMRHGSIVCWAAHQTEWPSEFANKGAWVSHWAHMGKGNDTSAAAKTKQHGKGN